MSLDDHEYLVDHHEEIDAYFDELTDACNWGNFPAKWRKSPGVFAYLLWQKRPKTVRNVIQAGRQLLETHLEDEVAFESLLYNIAGELKGYEKDDAAIALAFSLLIEYLRKQSRGSPRHLLAVIELGTTSVIEYMYRFKQTSLFEFALELFREATALANTPSWMSDFRKVLFLGRILLYRFKEFSEDDLALTITIQHVISILDLLPVCRPFRASVTEMVVTTGLIFMSRHLPTARWHDSLKLLALVLQNRLQGSVWDRKPDVVKKPDVASRDLLEGGLLVCSSPLASEAMCLVHIADFIRSTTFDCSRRPGSLLISLQMYRRNLSHPSSHYAASQTGEEIALLSAWSEEQRRFQGSVLSIAQCLASGLQPASEQSSIMIFQYQPTKPVKRLSSFSHVCMLHYYVTWLSELDSMSDTDSISFSEDSDSTSSSASMLPWPEYFLFKPDNHTAVSHLPSTIMRGVERVLQNEEHEYFTLPLEKRTIRAYIRSLDSQVRITESEVSYLSTRLVHRISEPVYWDPRHVGLNSRIESLKTNTPYISRIGPLQTLLSNGPERCLELVETSRSLFWSRLLRLRVSFSGLPDPIGHELQVVAQGLEKCKSQSARTATKQELKEQYLLESEFDHMIAKVRSIKGFENFLKPKTYDKLLTAASEGPVIVLVGVDSLYAAVILQRSGLSSVLLPDLKESVLDKLIVGLNRVAGAVRRAISQGSDYNPETEDESERALKKKSSNSPPPSYEGLLNEMWKLIVKPIFAALGFFSVRALLF